MRQCATIVEGGSSNATVSEVRAEVRAQTGSGLNVKMRPSASIRVAGLLGQCAREAGELEGASHGCWCDVLLVVMPLQALREEPLASTLRWPGDDEATCGGRGATRGPASNSQRGQPSVRDNANVLSVSVCTATDQGRHWMAQIADYCCPC